MNPGSAGYFETDWDVYASEGKSPVRGQEGIFSWSRFEKDVEALKRLGVSHYRFGVEWARIEPQQGRINTAALEQYARMARRLREAGIEPVVTLWHFTFPGWTYDPSKKEASGFLYPGIGQAWRAHVGRTVRALGPYVSIWVPQNEPNGALPLGYLGGYWPPGLLLRPDLYKKAMKESVNQFRDAVAVIRDQNPDATIVGVYSIPLWRANWWADPTFLIYNTLRRTNFDHLDQTEDVCDFIGVNYYYTKNASLYTLGRDTRGEAGTGFTQQGWEIHPEGLYTVLDEVYHRYGKPLVVTENGLGTISEQKKIRYFREHIAQMRRAMALGVDVRGYFAWTLADNFEWQEGWSANFGLTHFDKKRNSLRLEASGRWFQEFIKTHPLP